MAFCSTTQFGVTLLAVCLFTIIIVLLNLVSLASAKSVIAVPGPLNLHVLLCRVVLFEIFEKLHTLPRGQ